MKKIFLPVFLIFCFQYCYPQAETERSKLIDHYIGVQANQLLRQIINFSSSSVTATDNPYLLIYSANLVKSGWGLQAGMGYNYQKIEDKEAPGNRASKFNDFFGRIGLGKKLKLGKKL